LSSSNEYKIKKTFIYLIGKCVCVCVYIHSKKCWVVLTQFWVKYGQTRNVGLKM